MAKHSINKEILRLAVPNILSNLSVPLLSTVDTALMGRLSEEHLGAVGIGAMIFNFIYWNFGFLRMGTTGITAQNFGRNDNAQIITTLVRAAILAVAIAALMLMLWWPLREAGVYLMQAGDPLEPLIRDYFDIRILAAPASLLLYAAMGWFFGMQNVIYPLIITVCVNIVNVVASLILVVNFGLEIRGVAWGTVIAQYFGVVMAIALFSLKYRKYLDYLRMDLVRHLDEFRKFIRINRDIFLRTLSLSFAFGFFYSQSSTLGAELLAVNVILLQFVNWMSYGIDGFAYATESIVGKYFGADNRDALYRAIRLNFAWALGVAALYAAIYGLFGDAIYRLFTDQADVISAGKPYLFWMWIVPLAGFACYIWDGVYIGLTASRAMRNSMAIALAIFILTFFATRESLGNHGLWVSLVIFLAARGLIQWRWFARKGVALQ